MKKKSDIYYSKTKIQFAYTQYGTHTTDTKSPHLEKHKLKASLSQCPLQQYDSCWKYSHSFNCPSVLTISNTYSHLPPLIDSFTKKFKGRLLTFNPETAPLSGSQGSCLFRPPPLLALATTKCFIVSIPSARKH